MSEKITTIGQGNELFRQGSKGGELYFIKTGQVELSVTDEETGKTAIVAVVGDSSVLGTMTFLEGEPRSATAKALTELKVVIINQAQREKLLKTVPKWFQVLVKDLSANLRRANSRFTKQTAEFEVAKKKLAILENQKKEAEEKSEKIEAQTKELSNEVEKLQKEVAELTKQLAAAQASAQAAQAGAKAK